MLFVSIMEIIINTFINFFPQEYRRAELIERMSTTKINLKPVGKIHSSLKKLMKKKQACFDPDRQYDRFEGQIVPTVVISESQKQQRERVKHKRFHISKRNRQDDMQYKFNLIEDPRESEFSYRKYLFMEKLLLMLSVFAFGISVINAQMFAIQKLQGDRCFHNITVQVDKISSIITLSLIFATIMRYVALNELQIDQKKYYCIRTGYGIQHEIYRLFKRFQNIKYLFVEILLIIPHQFFVFHEYHIQLEQTYDGQFLNHRVNDLLALFSLCRIYIVMRSMINLTLYSTPRASRLCSQNRVEHSLLYTLKCLLKQDPVKIITFVFLINQITLGFGLRISEGSLFYLNPLAKDLKGFHNYINCFWCVFITMATVGYGDYYPITLPGRVVGVFAAISGIIMSSLLIVSLSAYLTMQANEAKSHLTLVRLQHQQCLKQQATKALIETMKMTKFLSSQQKSGDHKIKQIFTVLKHKIDKVKFRSRQIKSLVNNSNLIEQMNRLFQLFKDNLHQSYRNQIDLKEKVEKMCRRSPKQNKMSTVFLTHNMEEIFVKKNQKN